MPRPRIHSLSLSEKIQFFGEQRQALFVGRGQMRKIRAPETAPRAEGIYHTTNQRVKCRERVGFFHVTRQGGDLNSDIL